MDIEKLKFFLILADSLNFHRASETCNVSPSTLSRNIQQLESRLKTRLFERDNKSVVLTRQGELFLAYARETLQRWDTVIDSMQTDMNQLAGTINLYCSVTASYSFLYDILRNFRQRHPKIEIKLHTGDPALAIERIVSGEEDIAIAAKPDKMPNGVNFKTFARTPLVFIAPKKDGEFQKLTARMPDAFWSQIPMIIPERGLARERLNRWFQKKNITPNVYAQISGNEAIVSMVSLGFGIGLVPRIVVENSPLQKSVKLFSHQPELQPYEVGICVLSRRLKSPLVEAFWTQIPDQ